MENKTKTNEQLFGDYYALIATTHSAKCRYEAKRLLGKFQNFCQGLPPTVEFAVQFLAQFQNLKLNSRARYASVLSAFFRWYSDEELPVKITTPKILPQFVPAQDIDRLVAGIKGKKTHKRSIERDVLLIETARMTGLRRGELANLKVGDLHFDGTDSVLVVRGGKEAKDRAVSLNPFIRDKLAKFTQGKAPSESVFGLAPKTISLKISQWARKAGVPHLHCHSLRHFVGTSLFQKGANPRAIQECLGHQSLETTMCYAAVLGRDTKKAMELLQPERIDKEEKPSTDWRTNESSSDVPEEQPARPGRLPPPIYDGTVPTAAKPLKLVKVAGQLVVASQAGQ